MKYVGIDMEQKINLLAIEVLEQLGWDKPSQKQIDAVESKILDLQHVNLKDKAKTLRTSHLFCVN